jgi:hypothetical protein
VEEGGIRIVGRILEEGGREKGRRDGGEVRRKRPEE